MEPGVPQRELMDRQETIGFQREENPRRLEQLSKFFSNASNVSQNPLLCAQRSEQAASFDSSDSDESLVRIGTLRIEQPDLSQQPLTTLFRSLEEQLRARQPELANATVNPVRMQELQQRLSDDVGQDSASLNHDISSGGDAITEDEGISGLFASETHVLEFWQEIKARLMLLEALDIKLREEIDQRDEFLGFDRDALAAYLKPVFLVDGQHRLRGAILAARNQASEQLSSDAIIKRIDAGEEISEITDKLIAENTRLLPVSLLMNPNVEEHVFQFVVVNQKATPVGKALLGTIVATSLTESELDKVTDRLEQVQINVATPRRLPGLPEIPSQLSTALFNRVLRKKGVAVSRGRCCAIL